MRTNSWFGASASALLFNQVPFLEDKVEDWQSDLAGCFNNLDRLFALHAMDEDLAFRLLARARAERVTWRQMSNAIRNLLEADGCSVQHIEREIQKVEPRFRPWLRPEDPRL